MGLLCKVAGSVPGTEQFNDSCFLSNCYAPALLCALGISLGMKQRSLLSGAYLLLGKCRPQRESTINQYMRPDLERGGRSVCEGGGSFRPHPHISPSRCHLVTPHTVSIETLGLLCKQQIQ